LPQHTSDDLFINIFSKIDLGVGPEISPFDFDKWSDQAKHYAVPAPPPIDQASPPTAIEYQIPVSAWEGKSVDIFIRTADKDSRFSSWSNRVHLNVIPPLASPRVTAKDVRRGVMLSWPEEQDGAHYDVYRKGPNDKALIKIGTAEHNDYLDTASLYETAYQYTVIAAKGSAESLPSTPAEITTHDTYPPSVPGSIAALAAANSIEVTWERSPESDLKGYYVYRSINGGPFERIGSLINVPSYSDHTIQAGKTYRYRVSAVDILNHESDKSPATTPITVQ
jgi:fibronectin type 3 domain-containing protein